MISTDVVPHYLYKIVGADCDTRARRLDETPDEKNEDKPTVIYTEVARKTSDVRVENPDAADQYVIVRRITEITFSGTDSRNHRFVLNWPT